MVILNHHCHYLMGVLLLAQTADNSVIFDEKPYCSSPLSEFHHAEVLREPDVHFHQTYIETNYGKQQELRHQLYIEGFLLEGLVLLFTV